MNRGLSWYKRDPIAFLDGVQGLTPEVIGAYAVVLDLLYARAGEMPRDDRHLAGLLGCSIRKATALTDKLVELGKVSFENSIISNSRAKTASKCCRDDRETSVKQSRNDDENASVLRENNDLQPVDKIREDKRREEPLKSPAGTGGSGAGKKKVTEYPKDFDTYWSDWMEMAKRVNSPPGSKSAALKAWLPWDAKARELARLTIPDHEAKVRAEQRIRPNFTSCHAATFLNQGRFSEWANLFEDDDDEAETERGNGGGDASARAEGAGTAPDGSDDAGDVPAEVSGVLRQKAAAVADAAVSALAGSGGNAGLGGLSASHAAERKPQHPVGMVDQVPEPSGAWGLAHAAVRDAPALSQRCDRMPGGRYTSSTHH